MLRKAALAALLLGVACAQPPVRDELTIDFSGESGTVLVTAETTFAMETQNDRLRARVDDARAAATSGTDQWALRFASLTPESDRVTFQRTRGTLERVTRAVRIPVVDLQRALYDTHITVAFLHGDGWRELAFYPGGGSSRATREQQRHVESSLSAWSSDIARYLVAIDRLYNAMDDNPQRARWLFAAVLNEKGVDGIVPAVTEDEQPLVDAVVAAMDAIATRMDEQSEDAAMLAEEVDLLFNPFPARVVVRVPTEVVSSVGFSKDLVIEPVNLFNAVTALEGRWASPDPLTALLREESPTSATLAAQPRYSTQVVSATEIVNAIREQLARPKTYVVRFR